MIVNLTDLFGDSRNEKKDMDNRYKKLIIHLNN